MGILSFYRGEYKRVQLPEVIWTDGKIKEELKLIAEKKSTLSARKRAAVIQQAVKSGILKRKED